MASALKLGIGVDVLTAARERIAWAFDTFPRIYVSFSGGKDSSVMLHLAMEESILRGRKIGVLFIDLEAQYKLTIDHVRECFATYSDHIEPFWVALPLILRNAVSQFEPRWICWDKKTRAAWVREYEPIAITQSDHFPFFRDGMEFEEFVEEFAPWYAGNETACCMVGIRCDESLNRFRAIMCDNERHSDRRHTARKGAQVWNLYPLYDWRTEDIWTYNARENKPYNRLYDRMYLAGLTIHQQRICQPYGDDQRKGLWLYQVIEPETWGRVVARVNGANQGAMYAHKSGNMSGNVKVSLPSGHTWQSFARLLLSTMPEAQREHYGCKIDVFLYWWAKRGIHVIPDEADPKRESAGKGRLPSWRRICKVLLRNDYWAKGLSFSQLQSTNREQYKKMIEGKRKKQKWSAYRQLLNEARNERNAIQN